MKKLTLILTLALLVFTNSSFSQFVPYCVKDIDQGASSYPANFFDFNGMLFFTATDGLYRYGIWKSDGTSEGTILVKNFGQGTTASSVSSFINVNGTLFFTTSDCNPSCQIDQLWKSDGTNSGTVLVKDFSAIGHMYSDFTVVDNMLFLLLWTMHTAMNYGKAMALVWEQQ